MRTVAGRLALLVVLAATGVSGALAAPAAADPLGWKQCGDTAAYACGHLQVPLDRSGHVPGTVTLAVRRRRAPVGDESVAVFALAGGPGQGAIDLTSGLASLLGPALTTRDLIVFDQRRTGNSGPLKCPALKHPPQDPSGAAVGACARQLGPGRGSYT